MSELDTDVYRLAAKQPAVALFLGSLDGSISGADVAACRMLGRTEEELTRTTIAGITHVDVTVSLLGDDEVHRLGFLATAIAATS